MKEKRKIIYPVSIDQGRVHHHTVSNSGGVTQQNPLCIMVSYNALFLFLTHIPKAAS